MIFNMAVKFSTCFHVFKFCFLFFPVSPSSSWSSFIWPRVVWRFLQSSSANQVHLDMCSPCLCTKCSSHLEQNGLFAISLSNLSDSMNLPAMTDMLNDHHHDGHRHDHLTRSCLLAWRYSATWWSATRFSASTRSTCQIKRQKDEKMKIEIQKIAWGMSPSFQPQQGHLSSLSPALAIT